MRTKSLTRVTLAALLAATLVVAAPATAQEQEEETCEPTIEQTFTQNGTTSVGLGGVSGGTVTVEVSVEGCAETQLSLVSYAAGAAGAQGAFDSETLVIAEGNATITVEVPACTFRVDLLLDAAANATGNATTNVTDTSAATNATATAIASLEGGIGACTDLSVQVEVPCPAVRAKANGDGSITLSVDAAAEAGALLLYRAAGDDEMEVVGLLEGDTYVDAETEVGVTYRYAVVGVLSPIEDCPVTEVTSIPVFPGALGMLAAAGLGAVGYVATRRRR